MCGSGPKIPDPTQAQLAQIASTERMHALAMEQADRQFDLNFARQQELDAFTKEVTARQMEIADEIHAQGQDIFDYQKRVFRPIEESLAAEAMRESTPAYYEMYAQQAMANQAMANQNAQDQMTRQQQAMGINPNSGAYLANQRQMQLANAAGLGMVANESRDRAEALGWAKRAEAAGIGKGLENAGLGAFQLALQGHGGALTGAQGTDQQATNAMGTPLDYQRLGLQATTAGMQASNDIYKTQVNAAMAAGQRNNGLFGALGTGLGMWAGGGFAMP